MKCASPEIWRSGRTRDPLGVHRHDEHRQALVLRDVGVGPRQHQPERGVLGVRGPDLLAGDPPGAVLLLLGAGLDPGQVGAGGGLAEQLAPDLVGGQHRAEVALLLLLAAVRDQRRPEHPHADDVEDPGHAGAPDLLVDDDLLERPEAGAAVLGGPGDGGEARLGEPALPVAAGGHGVVVVRAGGRAPRRRAPPARRGRWRGTRPAPACRSGPRLRSFMNVGVQADASGSDLPACAAMLLASRPGRRGRVVAARLARGRSPAAAAGGAADPSPRQRGDPGARRGGADRAVPRRPRGRPRRRRGDRRRRPLVRRDRGRRARARRPGRRGRRAAGGLGREAVGAAAGARGGRGRRRRLARRGHAPASRPGRRARGGAGGGRPGHGERALRLRLRGRAAAAPLDARVARLPVRAGRQPAAAACSPTARSPRCAAPRCSRPAGTRWPPRT